MTEKLLENRIVTLLLLTGAVFFFLKVITPLTAPVLLALLFVTIFGQTLQRWQTRLHLHRQIGAVILLLLAGSILGVLVWVLFSWVITSMPQWLEGLDTLEGEAAEILHEICGWIEGLLGIDGVYLEQLLFHRLQEGIDYFRLQLLPGMLSQSLEYIRLLAVTGGFLLTFLIATVLLAKDYDDIMNRMLDREECHLFLEIICGIIRYLATFIKAQILIMGSIGGLAAVVLGICNIRHGVLWGLLAGLLDALPFVGTGVVLVPLGIRQLFLGQYGKALVCVLLYLVCIFIREVMEPKLIGRKIGVPSIAILLSIYAGLQLFGVCGILLGPLGFIMIQQSYASLERRRRGRNEDLTRKEQ